MDKMDTLESQDTIFIQAALDGNNIRDLIEEPVTLPIENLEAFFHQIKTAAKNILDDAGLGSSLVILTKYLLAHPKLNGRFVRITREFQIKNGSEILVQFFSNPNKMQDAVQRAQSVLPEEASPIDDGINREQQFMDIEEIEPVTAGAVKTVMVQKNPKDFEFKADTEFWDRYAKSPEEKKRYFFVGKVAYDMKVLIKEREVGKHGKKASELGNDWWNQLKPGLAETEYTRLTNKLFRFARDYLLQHAIKYIVPLRIKQKTFMKIFQCYVPHV